MEAEKGPHGEAAHWRTILGVEAALGQRQLSLVSKAHAHFPTFITQPVCGVNATQWRGKQHAQ